MNERLLKAPGYFVIAYFLIGVGITTFGPLEYVGYRSGIVASYIAFILVSFNFGYWVGSRTKCPTKPLWRRDQNKAILRNLFRVSLGISVLLMTYELLYAVLSGQISFNLASAADSYINAYVGYERNSGSYGMRFLITSMGAFPLFVAQVLGIFYFRSVNLNTKVAVIYLLVVTVLVYTLGGGKQKQFGDIIVYVVSLVLAHKASTGSLRLGSILKVGVFLAAAVYFLIALLAFRYQAIGVNLSNLNVNLNPLIEYRGGGWLVGILGEVLAFPVIMFSGYLGQGYYGLSLSLEQPFVWTNFAGSSYSISVISSQFFGADFRVLDSYPYRVGDMSGWDQSKWHTVFSWLASDLSFPGVVVFMGFMGFIYGRVWREILLFRNPFSIMMFATMNIGIVYAPANNQLMHSPGAMSSTLAVFLLYFLFHANFNAAPTALGRERNA